MRTHIFAQPPLHLTDHNIQRPTQKLRPRRLNVPLRPPLPHRPPQNWKGQALPILLNGLPSKSQSAHTNTDYTNLLHPALSRIASISPLAQVQKGTYRTPTFLIHGTRDDLIPWQQSEEFRDALEMEG